MFCDLIASRNDIDISSIIMHNGINNNNLIPYIYIVYYK